MNALLGFAGAPLEEKDYSVIGQAYLNPLAQQGASNEWLEPVDDER